jgi:hypothetical protein
MLWLLLVYLNLPKNIFLVEKALGQVLDYRRIIPLFSEIKVNSIVVPVPIHCISLMVSCGRYVGLVEEKQQLL